MLRPHIADTSAQAAQTLVIEYLWYPQWEEEEEDDQLVHLHKGASSVDSKLQCL